MLLIVPERIDRSEQAKVLVVEAEMLTCESEALVEPDRAPALLIEDANVLLVERRLKQHLECVLKIPNDGALSAIIVDPVEGRHHLAQRGDRLRLQQCRLSPHPANL